MTPGTLYVVATPIGNLEDITLRALRILGEVAVVAAEDTRRTGNLLRHYKIDTPLVSLHEHNEHQRLPQMIARLQRGESVALVSDAGTPGIADPGALLVDAARRAGLRVDPVPGPSAITAALSASGLSFDRFVFAGFAPSRSHDRTKWLHWVNTLSDLPVVAYETPHRIALLLADARDILVGRPIIIARELTKAHEEWRFPSSSGDPAPPPEEQPEPRQPEKGEFVIVFAPAPAQAATLPPTVDDIVALFGRITEGRTFPTRRDAIRVAAEQLGVAPKAVFDALEHAKRDSA